jgi:hypothetical protein
MDYLLSEPGRERDVPLRDRSIRDDNELRVFLSDLGGEYEYDDREDRLALTDDLTAPLEKYLSKRLEDTGMVPLDPAAARDLIGEFEAVDDLSLADRGGEVSFDVVTSEEFSEIKFRMEQFGYQLSDVGEPATFEYWIRAHFAPRRDACR